MKDRWLLLALLVTFAQRVPTPPDRLDDASAQLLRPEGAYQAAVEIKPCKSRSLQSCWRR